MASNAHLRRWSLAVRARDNNQCAVCGSTKYVQAHHLLPKERYPDLQLAPENGIALCAKHHRFGKYSAHRNAFWFVDWFTFLFPWRAKWVMEHLGKPDGYPQPPSDAEPR